MNDDERDDARREIERVMHAYTRAVDANEPDVVVGLFIEDCVTNYGPGNSRGQHPVLGFSGEMHGRREYREFLNGLSALAGTSHHLSNIDIYVIDADTAGAFSYLMAWHLLPDRNEFIVYGRYVDALVRRSEGWRFPSRRMLVAGTSGPVAGPWERLPRRT